MELMIGLDVSSFDIKICFLKSDRYSLESSP